MNIGFYVSIIRADKYRLLAGPYPTEPDARKNVDHFRKLACDYDARCVFDYFGTCKVTQDKPLPNGIFTPDQMKLC